MKILVLLRQVPDAESTLRATSGSIDLTGTQMVLDTMDEYGVEQALRLREAGTQAEIIVFAAGPARTEEALRSALALGADRAIHLSTGEKLDPIALSKTIAILATEEAADLILTGGRQTDWDSEALGAAVAERLGWPQLTWTTRLELHDRTLTGRHDIDDGSEAFSVELPAVITTQQGLNDPRYPTLPNIMKARRKELRTETLDRFDVTPLVRMLNAELQSKERARKVLRASEDPTAAISALAAALEQEVKVTA